MAFGSRLFAIALLLASGLATASPRVAAAPRAVASHAFNQKTAARYMERIAQRERSFYQAGVGYDGATGMSFDGHETDFRTGALRGSPRPWSAASKESLHLILLDKAIAGEHLAQVMVSPDPKDASRARAAAVSVLARKIASYEQFDRDYPGYGGFLPWYRVEHGKVAPTSNWTDRVPGLDNGQLAWSLYLTVDTLEQAGEHALAARYQAHLDKMRANVVAMFYDADAKQLRAEAKIVDGNSVAPAHNHYVSNQKGYFLDDAYEGLLLCHFADLMGDWKTHPGGKDAIFAEPRRTPASMGAGKLEITTARGAWFSSHEDWGYLVLPFRDVPIADRVFTNGQRARTAWSAAHGWSGLFASTHAPVHGNEPLDYMNALGVTPLGTVPTLGRPIFAPYAAFPLALVDKPLFAGWLSSMLAAPGMWGPYGIGESYAEDGTHAPVLTWDGKALPMLAWMNGIAPDIGRLLRRDGLYDAFRARVTNDFARFDDVPLKGSTLPLRAPPARN